MAHPVQAPVLLTVRILRTTLEVDALGRHVVPVVPPIVRILQIILEDVPVLLVVQAVQQIVRIHPITQEDVQGRHVALIALDNALLHVPRRVLTIAPGRVGMAAQAVVAMAVRIPVLVVVEDSAVYHVVVHAAVNVQVVVLHSASM